MYQNPKFQRRFGFRRGFNANNNHDALVTRQILSAKMVNQPQVDLVQPVFVPQNQFSDFLLTEPVKKNVLARYTLPTPIQDQTIPAILAGRDVIGISNTGTGKTAAFLIPLIDKVFKNKYEKVLIVTPTRELALQIRMELFAFAKNLGIFSVLCIGGVGLYGQKANLLRPHNFVIGTPGRIKDLVKERCVNLSQFHNVVLDEADRMVDIGFINDIKFFISQLPKPRQSLFFSATISGKVNEIIRTFVQNPVTISVKNTEIRNNIDQQIVKVVDRGKKVEQLHDLLISQGYDKVLIFGRTKFGVEKLSQELTLRGFKVGAIHGNKNQNQRQRTLDSFKTNQIKILLATDVASRGLDIDNVSHVINYDLPQTYEDYIHRVGRTGRVDKKGIAVTFIE